VVCDGTEATNYTAGTFQMFIDGGFGTFQQIFSFGGSTCTLLAPGPVSCFTDGGADSFTQVTFTQTEVSTCIPAGCGFTTCGVIPDSGPINWALTGVTTNAFTLTSVDPNNLGTCTTDDLQNPIVINFTAE
jgi:hypothetical protein